MVKILVKPSFEFHYVNEVSNGNQEVQVVNMVIRE